jgi:hypothetical protein
MPLHPEQHPLTPPEQEALNSVLVCQGIRILQRVVESRANSILVAAVNSAYQTNAGDALVAQSQKQIDEATRYRHCIEVLDELRKEKEHTEVRINTSKPKPPTTT